MSFVKINDRVIPKEDKVFALSGRAKAAIAAKGKDAVIDATIGALLDDNGDLVVMSSVVDAIRSLEPADYAAYAPIAGVPEFKEAVVKALFANYEPNGFVEVCATSGGTGSITGVVSNYSEVGDAVLTHDWCWANYKSICNEHGRNLATFRFFDENGKFDSESLKAKLDEISYKQDQVVLMINTPAHNPTGYSLSKEDWDAVIEAINAASCKVVLFIDVAYIDFAGEPDEVRAFLPVIDNLRANILPIIAYSASKTFTMYGARCAAMICMAHSPEVAEEFSKVGSFSARTMWSNSPRGPQMVIEKIYSDPELLAATNAERKHWRDMLLARGAAFETAAKEADLEIVPFRAGFFVTIPYDDPQKLVDALGAKDIFLIPIDGGVRVSIAAVKESRCRELPGIIKETIAELG